MSTLIDSMKSTDQIPGKQTIWEHGLMVQDYTLDLVDFLNDIGKPLRHEWKLPEWIHLHREKILNSIYTIEVLKDYTLFHDCGKPSCREKDEAG